LLKLSFNGHPLHYNKKQGWHYLVDGEVTPLEFVARKKTVHVLSKRALKFFDGGQLCSINSELTLALCNGRDARKLNEELLPWPNQHFKPQRLRLQMMHG